MYEPGIALYGVYYKKFLFRAGRNDFGYLPGNRERSPSHSVNFVALYAFQDEIGSEFRVIQRGVIGGLYAGLIRIDRLIRIDCLVRIDCLIRIDRLIRIGCLIRIDRLIRIDCLIRIYRSGAGRFRRGAHFGITCLPISGQVYCWAAVINASIWMLHCNTGIASFLMGFA